MRALFVSVMLLVAAACTFPDVDYADGGAGSGAGSTGGSSSSSSSATTSSTSASSGTCTVPENCATDAVSCADQKNQDHTTCVDGCKGNPVCNKDCDSALKTALGQCAALCDNCTVCKPNNCRGLVGL